MKKLLLSFVRRAAIAIMVILACAGISNAQSASLIRVEEDWVGLVGEPDTGISSPQILNVISPNANLNGAFGLVQLNHRGSPDFVAGGQQVQGWIGDTQTSYMSGTKTAQLYRISDNIRYTVAMEKVATGIRFETYGGRSRTWGRFNSTPISVTVQTTDNNLDGYSTAFSTSNTTVNLGAHRIATLYITATRLHYSDGNVVTDLTDRFTHSYQLAIEDVPVDTYEANPEDYEVDITEQ